jgi:hypothetical protein
MAPVASATAQPVGDEFQVNTYTTGYQRSRSDSGVAAHATGNFVVVWHGTGQGDDYGIFAQRYDSNGAALGSELRVNSYTTDSQADPAVAMDASGNFVVVWQSRGQDGSEDGIFGQRFDSKGVPQGGEFQVNSYTLYRQYSSSISTDTGGNFVVVWNRYVQEDFSRGIFGQRYDSGGNAQGDEFRVPGGNTPAVASAAAGDFVVVWSSSTYNPCGTGLVLGQRYDSQGVPQGAVFQVNSHDPGTKRAASVAYAASGDFAVVWEGSCQDGFSSGIFGQRFDGSARKLGNEFRANTYTTQRQSAPSITYDTSGNFVVVWDSLGQDGSSRGVFGQRYDSGGAAQGNEFQVNSFTDLDQDQPSARAVGDNQFVVVWGSEGDQDGDGFGVFGRRYDFSGAQAITVVRPNSEVRWRIGALEHIQWTHNLGADATFRIELDRDDDGEFEELIAAEAAVDNPSKGSFAWNVTGPRATAARVRVSWTDDSDVADASDVTFQIRPVGASPLHPRP